MLASKPSQQVESDSRPFGNPSDSVKADRALVCPPAAITNDPQWPADGDYLHFDYVPWFTRMTATERLQYLGWRIAPLKAELAQWYASQEEDGSSLAAFSSGPARITGQLRSLERQRRIELADLEPLSPHQQEHYRAYLDSPRWKRKRQRKFVAVANLCEFPGCKAKAAECHHLHYDTFGFEENADLEALCRPHHEVRHGLR